MTNLLSRLNKWVTRQDENFQTEAFVHLLEHLLAHQPIAASAFLKRLTEGRLILGHGEAERVSISTQVVLSEGRPDIEIRVPGHLVFIEAKVEAEPEQTQLSRYRRELDSSGVPNTCLVFLSKYRTQFAEQERPDVAARWFEVADWLEELEPVGPVGKYVVDQFVGFLRTKGLTMERVTDGLTAGAPAIYHFFSMATEVLTSLGCTCSSPQYSTSEGTISFWVNNQRFWMGISLTEPEHFRCNTYWLKVDKDKVDQLGLSEGYFESAWPRHTNGPHRWRRWLEFDAPEIQFFKKAKAEQVDFLMEFLKDFVEKAAMVEAEQV